MPIMQIDIDLIPENIALYQRTDTGFVFVKLNQHAHKTLDEKDSELLKAPLAKLYPNLHVSELTCLFETALQSKSTQTLSSIDAPKSSQLGWEITHIVPLDDQHLMTLCQDQSNAIQTQASLANLGKMIDNSDNEYYIFCKDSLRLLYVNQSAEKNLGYTLDELKRMTPLDFKPDVSFDQFLSLLKPLRDQSSKQVIVETRHQRKDGSFYDIEARVQLMTVGKTSQYVGTILDITERKKLESSLASLGHIVDNSSNEIYLFHRKDLKFVYANQIAQKNTGYSLEELEALTPFVLKCEYSYESFLVQIDPILTGETDMVVFETRHQRKDGSFYDVEARVQLQDIDSESHFVAIVVDISERKAQEKILHKQAEELTYLANHDNLTGLPNRTLFMDRLYVALKKADREYEHGAVLFLDLDNFKHINDEFGHGFGDAVLTESAKRLEETIRASDTVARLGGDEFVILLENLPSSENAAHLANKVLEVFEAPIQIDKQHFEIGISIGIANFPEDSTHPEALLSMADKALYQVKRQGKNSYQFYE